MCVYVCVYVCVCVCVFCFQLIIYSAFIAYPCCTQAAAFSARRGTKAWFVFKTWSSMQAPLRPLCAQNCDRGRQREGVIHARTHTRTRHPLLLCVWPAPGSGLSLLQNLKKKAGAATATDAAVAPPPGLDPISIDDPALIMDDPALAVEPSMRSTRGEKLCMCVVVCVCWGGGW